jgi:hypothetical protein
MTHTKQDLKAHLQERHLDVDLHRPMLSDDGVATFYLWTTTGRLAGYQQYRPSTNKKKNNDPKEGRYYTYRSPGTMSLWGVESLCLSPSVVFLTEGVFDAARLTSKGYSALALLSNNFQPELHNYLRFLNRRVVAVCDNGDAGRKLSKFGHESVTVTDFNDLGEATDSYVNQLLAKYT